MSELRCPYCLAALEQPVTCVACCTPHHGACFREHGQCTQLGCDGRETTRDLAASPAPGWELHPFLATRAPDEEARFLSLRIHHDPAPGVQREPRLRAIFPQEVRCGELLHLRLRVFVPRALHGRGLRLTCRLSEPAEHRYEAQANLLGRASASWLERIRLPGAAAEERLFAGGRTELELRCDPSPLIHRARLPEHPRFGVYHALELSFELESQALDWASRPGRVLVRHRPGRCGHRRPRDPWPDARLR